MLRFLNFELLLLDGSYILGICNIVFLKLLDIFFRVDKIIYFLGDGSLKFIF